MLRRNRYPAHPCPKCQRRLKAAGEVTIGGQAYPVYLCDECLAVWDFDGARFETALSFAVDAAGRLIDPESCEPLPPGWTG